MKLGTASKRARRSSSPSSHSSAMSRHVQRSSSTSDSWFRTAPAACRRRPTRQRSPAHQDLPADTIRRAIRLRLSYANQNGGDVLSADIVVSSTYNAERYDQRQGGQETSRATSARSSASTRRVSIRQREGARRLTPRGEVRRADGRQLQPRADPKLQREPQSDLQRSHPLLNYDPLGAPGAFGMLNLGGAQRTPGLRARRPIGSSHGFDQYLRPRQLPLRPGRQVLVVAEHSKRTRRAHRHRPPVPGLQDPERHRAERAVRHHRLDRFQPHVLCLCTGTTRSSTGYFTEYIAEGILAQGAARVAQSHLWSEINRINSSHQVRSPPQALSNGKRKDYELPRQEHRDRRRLGSPRRHPDEHLRHQLQASRPARRRQGDGSRRCQGTSRPAPPARTLSTSTSSRTETVPRKAVVAGAISTPAQLAQYVATQDVYAGEQVSTRRFAPPKEQGIRSEIKGTQRAYEVNGDGGISSSPARSRTATTSTWVRELDGFAPREEATASRHPRRPAATCSCSRAPAGQASSSTIHTRRATAASSVQLRFHRCAGPEAVLDPEERPKLLTSLPWDAAAACEPYTRQQPTRFRNSNTNPRQ